MKLAPHALPDVSQKQFENFFETLANGDRNLTMSLMNLYGGGFASRLQKLIDAVGDYYFKCPTNQFVDGLRKHGAIVYQLEFSQRFDNDRDKSSRLLFENLLYILYYNINILLDYVFLIILTCCY